MGCRPVWHEFLNRASRREAKDRSAKSRFGCRSFPGARPGAVESVVLAICPEALGTAVPPMRVFVVEAWNSGSHKMWVDGMCAHSSHEIHSFTHDGIHWRWRLQGGAVTLADAVIAAAGELGLPDVLVVSATVDVAALVGIARRVLRDCAVVTWFHENQLTYPPTPQQRRDPWPAWTNWKSALVADRVVFNSEFHRRDVFDALPRLLGRSPDYLHDHRFIDVVESSVVLPVGVEFAGLIDHKRAQDRDVPLIVWNHRWDDDKDPAAFVSSVTRLAAEGLPFEVALLGEDRHFIGDERAKALRELGDRVVAAGMLPEDEYRQVLTEANVVVSTANHEFFGVAVVEAIAAGCRPVVPNRLSYPEILGEFADDFTYGQARPTTMLKTVLDDERVWNAPPQDLRESMRRFDWSLVAPAYDDLFTSLA